MDQSCKMVNIIPKMAHFTHITRFSPKNAMLQKTLFASEMNIGQNLFVEQNCTDNLYNKKEKYRKST